MNEREQLAARIERAKLGFDQAQNESEKKLWAVIHTKLVLKYNRLRAERAGAKSEVEGRK